MCGLFHVRRWDELGLLAAGLLAAGLLAAGLLTAGLSTNRVGGIAENGLSKDE
jgi:hypothetical protein